MELVGRSTVVPAAETRPGVVNPRGVLGRTPAEADPRVVVVVAPVPPLLLVAVVVVVGLSAHVPEEPLPSPARPGSDVCEPDPGVAPRCIDGRIPKPLRPKTFGCGDTINRTPLGVLVAEADPDPALFAAGGVLVAQAR